MAATYINGNAFKVDFVLWKKDIVSYFWHAYFFHPLQYLTKTDNKRFIHAVGYALLLSICLLIAAKVLKIENWLFMSIYFPTLLGISMYNHFNKTIKASETLVGRHYSFKLDAGQMTIIDNHSFEEVVIDSSDILSIAEKQDMLIIYTKGDEYIIPTRVMSDSQIESVLAFK